MKRTGSGDKTKLAMAQSLRDLLRSKPFDKIKIREIVDNCGLNRQTFYYHFQDIYELVEWMYMHDGTIIIRENYDFGGITEIVHKMLFYIDEHRSELLNISNSKASYYFFNFLKNGIADCYKLSFERMSVDRNIPEAYVSLLVDYFTSALVGVLDNWIRNTNSERYSVEELLDMLKTLEGLHRGVFDNYIKNFK